MTMMMMANQAEPLDSSCTKTKYMSWVWRNGLEGAEGTQRLHTAEERGKMNIFMLFISGGKHQQVVWSKSDSNILAILVSELIEEVGFRLDTSEAFQNNHRGGSQVRLSSL